MWDNRQNSVKRWYDYEAGDNKIGTVCFEPVVAIDGQTSAQVQCRTEITYHPGRGQRVRVAKLNDLEEHKWLADLFMAELLDAAPIG